jgi:hypothetical protein
MRSLRVASLACALLVLSGCRLPCEFVRSVAGECNYHKTQARLGGEVRQTARGALAEYRTASGGGQSRHFDEGFLQAVEDYLIGGRPQPVVPPARYWNNTGARGQAAVADWFDGYRTGATFAVQEGSLGWVAVPTSSFRYASGIAVEPLPGLPPAPMPAEVLPPPEGS